MSRDDRFACVNASTQPDCPPHDLQVLDELDGKFMDLVRSCIGDRPPVRAASLKLAQLLQPTSCGTLMKVS